MGAKTGNYSGSIFEEGKNFVTALIQQGVPLVDRDVNDLAEIITKQLQRALQAAFSNQFVGDSFKIVGSGLANDFTVSAPVGAVEGDPETWGRGWVAGLRSKFSTPRTYHPVASPSGYALLEMRHRSTGLSALTLTDTSMKWAVNELIGRTLYPNVDVGVAPTGFTIIGNSATQITVSAGDMTLGASAKDFYAIGLTTPAGADRTDYVYLDVYLNEVGAAEDPALLHPIADGVEAQRRLRLVQLVHVVEGGSVPAGYVDLDGNRHYIVPLARLDRIDGNVNITAGMVTDLRDPWFGSGPEVVQARGSQSSLEKRLYRGADGVILPDGTLNPSAVSLTVSHADLADMPDLAGVVNDHDGRYGNKTYSAAPLGSGGVLVDDESHRDAISRLAVSLGESYLSRVIGWMNSSG